MTPRNDMSADPQAADAFEATSGQTTSIDDRLASSRPARSRRYTRIAIALPVVVRDQFGGREETRTQFVTVRGAVVATNLNLRVGHKLTLQIAKTGRAAECHVVGVEPKDGHSVEIEFTRDQEDFWPVQFPPEDLKTDSGSYRFKTQAAPSSGAQSGLPDPSRREGFQPPISRGSDELVSLADSISGNFFASTAASTSTSTPFNPPEKFASRSAPVDSVAQFRAANRAAHRREQRRKAFYSALSLAALAMAATGARYWMQHRSEIAQVSLPQVSIPKVSLPQVNMQSISRVLPKTKTAEKPSSTASNDETPTADWAETAVPRATERPHSIPQSIASETETPSTPSEIQPAETQIAVRHSASASLPKAAEDAGEEPLALPLTVDNGSTAAKPEVINSVVAQTPMKAALLAPQPVRKAVPARLVYSVPAQYPSMARQIHAEGEVVISLDVDTSGKVSAARAVSGPPILRTAALDAVKRWKYQPATLGDKPVVSTEVVKLQFKLR